MTKKIIVFLGPPGSGKGTQAQLLSQALALPAISTGELLREEKNSNTKLGERIKETIDQGDLVSDDLIDKIITKRLRKKDVLTGFVLDGFPRNEDQASSLEKKLEKIADTDQEVVVLYVRVSDQEVKKRLSERRVCKKCGINYHLQFKVPKKKGICDECGNKLFHRQDDKPRVIKHRLEYFHKHISPLIKEFQKKGWLLTINGEQSIKAIHQEIVTKLKKKFNL